MRLLGQLFAANAVLLGLAGPVAWLGPPAWVLLQAHVLGPWVPLAVGLLVGYTVRAARDR